MRTRILRSIFATASLIGLITLWSGSFGIGSLALQETRANSLALFHADEQQTGNPSDDQTQHPFVLKSERNLVLVRVVVHDAKGNLVDHLSRQDFRVFDNGKAQQITNFSVERFDNISPSEPSQPTPREPTPVGATATPVLHPPHFIALYFDDNHLTVESAVPLRNAAQKFLTSSWHEGDYAGVFTATGQTQVDFTNDLSKVQQAVARIMARPELAEGADSPDITPYEAYLIAELRDPTAELVAYAEASASSCPAEIASDPNCHKFAHQIARAKAEEVWSFTREETRLTFERMRRLIEHMAKLPGERTLAFLSPGLIVSSRDQSITQLIDLAIRNQVTVNSLDARGLFDFTPGRHLTELMSAMNTTPGSIFSNDVDIGGPTFVNTPGMNNPVAQKVSILHTEATVAGDPLAEIAEGTGGTFFHNSNDLVSGLNVATSIPGVEYLLGFSPDDLKANGAYHTLKVQIAANEKYQIQARKGYIAQMKPAEAGVASPDAVETTLYSGSTSQTFPIGVKTQSSAGQHGRAGLAVLVHVDIQHMDFRKKHDHYADVLIFRTALFNSRGRYVTGNERTLNLELDEQRFTSLTRTGLNAETQVTATPGDYLLREIVEEKSTGQLSAVSQPVKVQ